MDGNIVEIERIYYAYNKKNMVLMDFSLKIKKKGYFSYTWA
jgi:hypothetical protein